MKPETGMIEVTGCDLRKFIRAAYALSSPQGLGHFHAKGGDLDDDSVTEILERAKGRRVISMDYVHGRSVKMHVQDIGGRHFIHRRWYDHSPESLAELLTSIGKSPSLIDEAEAEYAAALEAEVADVLAALKSAGGSLVRNLDEGDSYADDHMAGLIEARNRGLVQEAFEYPITTWTLLPTPEPQP